MPRRVEFDIAKALCIILVVMGHYTTEDLTWWNSVRDIIYTFHMPLFMFASGFIYIAFKKEESYWRFLLKKNKRLVIPYVVTSIIIIAIKILTQSFLYVKNPVTPMAFLKIFYYPEAAYHLWFIWALWWMFCLVPLFKNRTWRTVLFAASVVLHYVQPYLALPSIFCIDLTVRMFMWFMLGVVCYDWRVEIKEAKLWHVGLAAVLFAVALALREHTVAATLCPFLGIAFVMCLSKWIAQSGSPRWLMTLSESSYIIYLFHSTFMGLALAILLKISFIQAYPLLVLVLVVAVGVVVPVLLQYILQRTRVTRFLFGLKK